MRFEACIILSIAWIFVTIHDAILYKLTQILFYFLQVQPKHVKEAFRLLNKSIIRVETPDVQFDDEEEQQEGIF